MEENLGQKSKDEIEEQNSREVVIEELAGEASSVGEWKSVVTSEALTSQGLLKKTKTSIRRLSCGHFVKTMNEIVVCACERTLCSACSQEAGKCENCGRALCRKCRRESLMDPNVHYCRRCRWTVWLRRIF